MKSPGKRRDNGSGVRDLSGIGFGNDVEDGSEASDDEDVDGICDEKDIESIKRNGSIPVHTLSREYFRKKLIRHFNICHERNELQWPERIKRKDKKKDEKSN